MLFEGKNSQHNRMGLTIGSPEGEKTPQQKILNEAASSLMKTIR
jgi:hypothetical protein